MSNEAAEIAYVSTRAVLHEWMTASQMYAETAQSRYPRREVDVDELVYVSLDEENHFERAARSVAEHIAEVQEIASRAPEDAEVLIEFEQDYGYDDDRVTVRRIGYWRDPTTEERNEREAYNNEARKHNAALAEREAATEREQYEKLKAKFETR